MPWRARNFVQQQLRWRAGRPQLKRDPLGRAVRIPLVRRRLRNHAGYLVPLLTVMVACQQLSQSDAVDRATALMQTQSDAAEYWLDSVRVYNGDSTWSVYFCRRDHVHREPGEGLVTVNKATGQVRRVPLR